jgi:hypothetical protein
MSNLTDKPVETHRSDPWDFWGLLILQAMTALCFTGFLITSAMFFNRWITLIQAGLGR